MKLYLQYLILILTLLFSGLSIAQGSFCDQAEPFCAGDSSLVFSNTSDTGEAEIGPNYGCLGSQPNPAWYFIQIDQSGELNFNIIQNTEPDFTGTGLDVDFITYGPFTTTNVCDQLSAINTIACSYSPSSVENFTITNGIPGEIYVLLITNYDNLPGYIQLEQTNSGTSGSGSTDCSIINTFNYCDGDVVALDATTTDATSYSWSKDGSPLSETGPVLSNVVAPDATYSAEAIDADGAVISIIEFIIDFHEVPTVNSIPDQALCDNNDNGFRIFDLNALNAIALGSQSATNYTVTYHTNQVDADNDTNALPSSYMNQIAYAVESIFVRIDNNNNTACYSTEVFSIEVLPNPTITSVPDYGVCDDATDGDSANGFASFDLSTQDTALINGQNVTITYFESQSDAEANINSIPNPSTYTNMSTNSQTIYYRLENTATLCTETGSFNIVVHALPEVQNAILVQCDEDGTPDGFTEYNLNEANENVMISGDTTGFNYTHYLTLAEAQSGMNPVTPFPFTNTSNPQTIYVRIENQTTGCFITAEYTLEVTATDIGNTDLSECDNDYDGLTAFTLSDADPLILTNVPQGSTVAYYETASDAQFEINQLPDNYTNSTPFLQTIFIRVENANDCFGIANMDLIVHPLPQNNVVTNFVSCSDTPNSPEIDLSQFDAEVLGTQNPADFTLSYHETQLDADNNIAALMSPYSTANNPQTVYVRVENNTTGCSITTINFEIVVVDANPIVTAELTTLAFSEQHNILVTVNTAMTNDVAGYEFSPDGGPWQSNAANPFMYTFTNVSAGEHIVRVRDAYSCSENSLTVLVIDYPLFFTPNGDEYNNNWNIYAIDNQPDAVIYIYDRYGKLLKQLSPTGQGWDGTYNGNPMPTSDYWFTVEYREPKTDKKMTFTAHFTLKR
ncbi:T9SS type B sorting domain-containing protein [Lacinutrix neustonica]|uniref:T9SS type B sorting domain-containing protein n=1 Tax=Lacinutrix neustonica TaxID=2980107 RepID=A0A9E8MUY5_9FLAO|nr:T9SS type B sorting domain-containing protein [Lacinutrix neustonica]WAC01856.1 T9SS type B sorting domain-containing protein [Lacinutrix neustonica]